MSSQKIRLINNKVFSQADPYVIVSNGKYYMYATNYDGVVCYSGDKIDCLEYRGLCLTCSGQKEFWAPCVIEKDGKFYMYYSSFTRDSDDVHLQRLKVAVSDYPDKDFVYICDLQEPFSIDAQIVKNEFGDYYMFYCVNDYESERAGTLIVVDKMEDMFTLKNEPKVVVRATLDEEIFQKDRFKKGQHWHTLEGAFYIYEDGYHYLMYSGNCYENENYYVGYAVAKSDEQDLTKVEFKKYPSDDVYAPLLRKTEQIEGTGHNSAIKIDNEWYVVHHARERKNQDKSGDLREAYITAIKIKDGVMTIKN